MNRTIHWVNPDFSLKDKKAFVLDLDGTVYLGEKPITSAIEFINTTPFAFYYLTNNTSKSKKAYLQKLLAMGIQSVTEAQIITPLDPLISYLKKHNIKSVYCVGTKAFQIELSSLGFEVLDKDSFSRAEALILAYDTELSYEKITCASILLRGKIPYLATHSDDVCPTEDGFIPDVGSFIAMFEKANKKVPDQIFGKPNVALLKKVLVKYKKEDIVISGDRLYTDKILAEKAGVDFALVLSGETNVDDCKKLDLRPSIILEELGDLTHFAF